jgi:hypothetical protein
LHVWRDSARTATQRIQPARHFPGERADQPILASVRTGAGDQSSTLLQALNAGVGLVDYCGHGSVERWSASGVLTSAAARALENAPRLPFVIAMTCLNAYFDDVYSESLAEALLRAEEGGAVAVWTSSGLTLPELQKPLNANVISALFDGKGRTIGEAILEAKRAVPGPDAQTWILLGDPATRLK